MQTLSVGAQLQDRGLHLAIFNDLTHEDLKGFKTGLFQDSPGTEVDQARLLSVWLCGIWRTT